MPTPLYNMVLEIFWYQITSAQLPFPTSRAISTLPAGNGALLGANADYNDPKFAGIYITSNGQSGGNTRWILTFTEEMVGKKIKVYINFGNNWYVYEIQVWGAGSWTLTNPGSGPSLPNQIIFGNPVDVFEDFEPNERDPNFPPPTFNPFQPIVTIEPLGSGPCSILDSIRVTLTEPANLTIQQVVVARNDVPYDVSLAELLAGFTFTQAGDYEMVIRYSFMGNPTETLVRDFTVLGSPYPYIQVERTFGGDIYAQTPIVFDHTLLSNGSISNDTVNGEIAINLCGVYLIKWFVVPQLGLTPDGVNFAIVSAGGQGPQGSGHVKVASTSGFSIIEVGSVPYTIQLNNISKGDITLSNFTQVTAGLVVVKIGDVEQLETLGAARSRCCRTAPAQSKGT